MPTWEHKQVTFPKVGRVSWVYVVRIISNHVTMAPGSYNRFSLLYSRAVY